MENKSNFCEHCGEKLEKNEQFCSKCGKKIGGEAKDQAITNNNKEKKKMPVWAIVLIVIFSLFVIGAQFSDNEELSSEPNNNSNSSETNSQSNKKNNASEKTKKEYNRNETVIYKGVKYSVTNVKHSNGSEFDQPANGKEYIIVTIKIENKSDQKISYNPYDWKMRNSQGQEEDGAFTTIDSDTSLHSGDLAAGGVKEGTIVFEEPKNDSSLKLLYFDNSLFDDEETFAIIIK